MKRRNQKYLVLFVMMFTILFVYSTNLDKLPSEIILFQNQNYEIKYMKGIKLEGKNLAIKNSPLRRCAKICSDTIGKDTITMSVFGGAIKKHIDVNVLPNTKVVLGGDTVGIRLYSKGVLVVGEMPVLGIDGKFYEPFASTSIEKGDVITKVNNVPVETIEELSNQINDFSGDAVSIEYVKDDATIKENIVPVKSKDDELKRIGLWVKDGVMGVGTLTYYNPDNMTYAALGHGISADEVKELIEVEKGKVNIASIVEINKGKKDVPGEIKGLLNSDVEIGTIEKNDENGIYGVFSNNTEYFRGREEISVASKSEIKLGAAEIVCTVDNDNVPKKYSIEIQKVSENSLLNENGMIIKVTDENLIRKTGGIIQGMSGSPIIQNGKLIGAVTHVFVRRSDEGFCNFC